MYFPSPFLNDDGFWQAELQEALLESMFVFVGFYVRVINMLLNALYYLSFTPNSKAIRLEHTLL